MKATDKTVEGTSLQKSERSEIMCDKTYDDMMKKAERLFAFNEIEEVFPMVQELSKHGYKKAKYILALIYEIGYTNIDRDYEKRDQLLDECIEKRYWPALVRKYLPHEDTEIKLNEEKKTENIENIVSRLDCLKDMAERGDKYAAEEYARCCVDDTISKDPEKINQSEAMEWFEKAPLVIGKYGLARLYEYGKGVAKNEEKAFKLYKQAANYGYAPAENKVGEKIYECKWICEDNEQKAFEYYQKAAEHGNHDAISNLAVCYYFGNGIEEDKEKAGLLFRKKEQLGIKEENTYLGECYLFGWGGDKDLVKAKKILTSLLALLDDDNLLVDYKAKELLNDTELWR